MADETQDQASSQVNLPAQDASNSDGSQLPQAPAQGGSRLASILGAVAKTASTAMAGIPQHGRASFVQGLGQGARAEQAAQATDQSIKMRDFDNSVRLANLHNQDLQQQGRTQEQNDAHQKFEDFQKDYDEAHGIEYDAHPNDGEAVTQSLKGQTAANGAASIAPGTHLGADGKTINIPSDNQNTQAGLLGKYKELAGVVPGIPAFPGMDKAAFVPSRNMDVMTHVMQGYNVDGSPMSHEQLKAMIPSLQAQRDNLAKNGGTPYQLGTLDSMINVYKANEKGHSDAEDAANEKATKQAATRAGAVEKAKSDADIANKEALENLKAKNKAAAAATASGDEWKPKVSGDEKKRAELSENITYNANSVAQTLIKRPDLVGAVAGRYSTVKALAGSNDPDLVSLGTEIHNIAIASIGVHGMRSGEQVTDVENRLLNHFKNGPQGIAGGLKSLTDSVQTFIDNARPEGYRTHSKNGGALRAMVKQ